MASAPVTLVAVLVLFLPHSSAPFSVPKAWVLLLGAGLGLPLLLWRENRSGAWALPAIALAQLLLLGVSAGFGEVADSSRLLIQAAGSVALLSWTASRLDRVRLAKAAAWGGTVVGAVTLLQAFGFDPLGASANGERLRLYGTLGNPDFVAAVLVPTALLSAAVALKARGYWAPAMVQVAALISVRSFATVLAITAAALLIFVHRRKAGRWVGAFAVAILLMPFGRSARSAIEGRHYLNQVVAPHLFDAPLFGRGPGAVEAYWPLWEVELWQARCGDDPACVVNHPDRRFAGLQDHVHDDYAEKLIELGAPSVLLIAALAFVLFGKSAGRRDPLTLAALGGFASLLARATVDFPLARPAELCVLAATAAIASAPQGELEK